MALESLGDIIETFQSVDDELRLELLLDYARKLPPLPQRLHAQRDAGLHRVPECMTPVFLWVETENDKLRILVDVAEESPTVRGMISLIVHGTEGASPKQVADELPADLVDDLGLSGLIRMQRAVGLGAIIARIKRAAAQAAKENSPAG